MCVLFIHLFIHGHLYCFLLLAVVDSCCEHGWAFVPFFFNLMMATLRPSKLKASLLIWVTLYYWESWLGLCCSKPVSVFPLTVWGLEATVFSSPSKPQIPELSILFRYSLKSGHFSPVLISSCRVLPEGVFLAWVTVWCGWRVRCCSPHSPSGGCLTPGPYPRLYQQREREAGRAAQEGF